MKTLKRLTRKIDRLDDNMIRLFEMRMNIVKKIVEYKRKHDLQDEKQNVDVVDKVTTSACDLGVIEYTEGLMMYIKTVTKNYQRKLTKQK